MMANRSVIPAEILSRFEVFDWRNGLVVLANANPDEWRDISCVLSEFSLGRSDIEVGGGNKSPIAKRLDEALSALGWMEKKFDTKIVVDNVARETPTHAVDCFRGRVALEVEWNNKDPFFDRDLNNFRLLYDLGVIDVGVIVTRTTALQTVLKAAGRSVTTYGKATTHTEKLYPKIKGGGAGGCPLVVFGILPGAFRDG
jgi:hypothetical protein